MSCHVKDKKKIILFDFINVIHLHSIPPYSFLHSDVCGYGYLTLFYFFTIFQKSSSM
uniref:Uncharacterized protein n=1 Tax=Anguilla anguilla TaxID=7936 RepID=A0A0E9SSH7_ANGAN